MDRLPTSSGGCRIAAPSVTFADINARARLATSISFRLTIAG
jgi:hypothetical protein